MDSFAAYIASEEKSWLLNLWHWNDIIIALNNSWDFGWTCHSDVCVIPDWAEDTNWQTVRGLMEQKCCHTEHEQNISKPSHGCGCSEGRILHIHYNWPRSCYSWRPAPTSRCCHSDGMLVLGIKQHRLNYHSIITYFRNYITLHTIDILHKKVPTVTTMTSATFASMCSM